MNLADRVSEGNGINMEQGEKRGDFTCSGVDSTEFRGNSGVLSDRESQKAKRADKTISGNAHENRIGWLMARRFPFLLARLILGFILVYASLDKILHPDAFAKLIYNYQLLPHSAINLTAIVLPWLELILGALLLCGIWMHGAVALTTLLLALFFSAMVISAARGLDIHCGCFTTNPEGKSELVLTMIRDFTFLAVGVFLSFETYFRGLSQRVKKP